MALKVQDYLESVGVNIVLEKALNNIRRIEKAEIVVVGNEHVRCRSCYFIYRYKAIS